MPKPHKPRSGSLQFYPRKRAKRIYPRIRSISSNFVGLSGFAGYKVGMTHVVLRDNRSNSVTRGCEIVWPATVIECPPLSVFSLRLYGKNINGKRAIGGVISPKIEENLKRKIKNFPKKYNFEDALRKLEEKIKDAFSVSVLAYTQPHKAGVEKKRPEVFELFVGCKGGVKEAFEYAKSLFEKKINVKDVFKEANFTDIHGVTKGKGFQGVIKRYGVALKSHKSQKKRRSGGNLGPWNPEWVSWTIPQPGKMGFHTRTEYNKLILKIGSNPEDVNPKGGFINYGNVKSDYILVKGSVCGSVKRMIRLNIHIRKVKGVSFDLLSINKESKQ